MQSQGQRRPLAGGIRYRQLLTQGEKGFTGEYVHGGVEPFYPPSVVGSPPDYRKRVMCDVLRTNQAGVAAKWYFRRSDQDKWYMPQAPTGELLGFEVAVDPDEDPCEVYLSDYAQQNGGAAARPHGDRLQGQDLRGDDQRQVHAGEVRRRSFSP